MPALPGSDEGRSCFGIQTGRLSDRIGRKPLIIASCWGTIFLAMVLLAMRLSPFQALLTALSDGRERGSLMSLVVALGQLGGGLGAAAAGLFVLVGLPEPERSAQRQQ